VIAAVAVTLALVAPSREALIERWLTANRTHTAARLKSGPRRATGPHIVAPPPDLRALAQRELSITGRYQLAITNPTAAPEPWWMTVWNWMADRWKKFWNAIFGRVHVGKAEAASIGDLLLVAVALLLIFVIVRLLWNLQLARSASRVGSEPLTEPPTPRALYRQACNAATRGDYGTAALLLFAATVALLDRRGAVDATSSSTVGDMRRELRARNTGMVAPFDEVATPFVQTAYAERAVDEPQWHRARAAYDTLSDVILSASAASSRRTT
jgi:hypothetical protein